MQKDGGTLRGPRDDGAARRPVDGRPFSYALVRLLGLAACVRLLLAAWSRGQLLGCLALDAAWPLVPGRGTAERLRAHKGIAPRERPSMASRLRGRQGEQLELFFLAHVQAQVRLCTDECLLRPPGHD